LKSLSGLARGELEDRDRARPMRLHGAPGVDVPESSGHRGILPPLRGIVLRYVLTV
jgi:hypothetical protein